MTHECTKFEQRPLPSGKKSNFVSLSVCLNRGWRRAVNKGAKIVSFAFSEYRLSFRDLYLGKRARVQFAQKGSYQGSKSTQLSFALS